MKFPSHHGSWALSWALSFISSIFPPLCFISSILCPKFHLIFLSLPCCILSIFLSKSFIQFLLSSFRFIHHFLPIFSLYHIFHPSVIQSVIQYLSLSMSFIHLFSKVSSIFNLFLVFHPSSYLFSLVPLIHLHFLPDEVIFKLSSHQFLLPTFFPTSKDFGFDACCCFLEELVRRFVPLLLLLLLLQSKSFLPLELKVGAFGLFWGGGDLKLPHRFSSFLGVWSLFFSPLEVVYVLRICTSTFSISSSLFALLCVLGSCCCCCCGTWKSFMLLFKFCWGLGFEGLL